MTWGSEFCPYSESLSAKSQANACILAFTALRVYALRAHWLPPSIIVLLYAVSIGIDLVRPHFFSLISEVRETLMSK